MKFAPVREGLLAAPVLIYLSIGGMFGLTSATPLLAVGFLLGAGPIAGLAFRERAAVLWWLPLLGGFLVFLGGTLDGNGLLPPWDGLFAGLLLGLPLAALAALLRPVAESAPNFLLLLFALVEGLGLRAAGGGSPSQLSAGFLDVFAKQLAGLGAWAGGTRAPELPLSAVNDPLFLGLALLAVGGAILGFLRLPVDEGVPRAAREFDLLLVAGALGAGAVFEAVALGAPTFALVVLGAATLASVIGLVLLLRGVRFPRPRVAASPAARAP
ncbi:MAG: hypothetical protein L3K13_02020 [Thermoplasmata archaeon]|nr:hypothetical protein [Thermoplasmata archaeon]